MTIDQAIDYVYASYLKAEPHLEYGAADSEKRNPTFSREIILKLAEAGGEASVGTGQEETPVQGMQKYKPTVLITGSKGKGSVSKMIAEILGDYGKTGLMTSPHILRFNERIQLQGQPVSDQLLAEAITAVKPEFDRVEQQLSEAEYISPMGIQAAAALIIFSQSHVQFQVMECGKGVAYDDVNNVPHDYAVINRIFLEHTRELGDTLEKIAENKAAIITSSQKAVFISEQEPEVLEIFRNRAEEQSACLYEYGRDFRAENITYTTKGMCFDVVTSGACYRDIQIPLLGTYQAKNAALAIALCEKILGEASWKEKAQQKEKLYGQNTARQKEKLYEQNTAEGRERKDLSLEKIKEALSKLNWPGRLEVLSANPLILLDACINRESCANVLEALNQLGAGRIITIIGIPADKDYQGVVQEMAAVSEHIILTKSQNAHYKFGPKQAKQLYQIGFKTVWTDSVTEALEQAEEYRKETGKREMPVCILGTTSLISDVKLWWK